MRMVVLVDNHVVKKGLRRNWGLSIYIEVGSKKFLFDTGGSSEVLLWNAKYLDIDLSSIDFVVISHEHFDHVGGISALSSLSVRTTVYIPYHASISGLRKYVEKFGHEVIAVSDTREIGEGIFIVGEQPSRIGLWEEALAVKTAKGYVLFVGCSHPGIDRIARKTVDDLGKLHGIIGGFHNPPKDALDRIIDLKPDWICPIHCSGSFARDYLSKYAPDKKIKNCGAGLELII